MNTIQASGNYNPQYHLEFLGLLHNPFPVAPDNTDFYISQHNDRVIENLTQSIVSRKGFMLLTGEIGLGKTTLSRRIIQTLEQHQVETSLILQSFFQGENLLKEIIQDFGIRIEETQNDLSALMTRLNDFLLEKNKAGINCAILIDDAQNLNIESLELIRMISNLEGDREKLVQILLVGQPELIHKLNRQELRQLKSRVTIKQSPLPLRKSELGKYIQFKLNMAGDPGKIIVTPAALKKLYQLTSGNLRKTNILMDKALHTAFLEKTYRIKPEFIARAEKELAFDMPDRKRTRLVVPFILLLLLLIIAGIGGGATFFYYHSGNADKNSPPAAPQKAPQKAPQPTDRIVAAEPVFEEKAPNQTGVTESVASFLAAYGLESFSTGFQQALDQKNITDIRNKIFHQTGYQLIHLKTLTPSIREKFDVLSSVDPVVQKTECYLFWKPWLKIEKFYFGYRGKEISDLQKLLSRIYLYDYTIDGIVGQKIMKSVKDFQEKGNLPVTGFPDPETVFLLANTDS